MKHKHAELIHAWADGAEIQYETAWCEWKDVSHPQWFDTDTYRIKPEEKKPVVRWLWAWPNGDMTDNLHSEDEIKLLPLARNYIKLEWSRTEFPE